MANPPAGWHPDPLNRHAQRYWDGNQWTEHVADQAGNMSTDPLDGGRSARQSRQGASDRGQSDQSRGGSQESTQDSSPGGDGGASGWGEPDRESPTWGDTPTGRADTGTTRDDEAEASRWTPGATEATDEPAWGEGGAATGAAAAAGSVAATEGGSAPVAAEPGEDDSIEHLAAASHAEVRHPTIAEVTVGAGVVVRHGHVVAASAGIHVEDSEHPGAHRVTGGGSVQVGADGRELRVLDVPASGLTIQDEALVAHSDGLSRVAASAGIVGYHGTAVTGGGWVLVAAVGGAVDVSPIEGVVVSPAALVAFSSDLDVSHGDRVTLSGRGAVLVSAATT